MVVGLGEYYAWPKSTVQAMVTDLCIMVRKIFYVYNGRNIKKMLA